MLNKGTLISAVKVITSARLHLGFFDLNGDLERKFGSMGISLDNPVTEMVLRPSKTILATGAEALRAVQVIHQIKASLELPANQGVEIEITQAIPSHAGLGSGTQLALAVGVAFCRLYGLKCDARYIAEITARGVRSGIGIGTFLQGGLIVDGGRGPNTLIPPILARIHFPEIWRILIIMDTEDQGISGEQESKAFNRLQPVSSSAADKLCRQVLMQALPALLEADLPRFGVAVNALQQATGDYFAPIQGGRYASKKITAVLEFLQQQGVTCFGQSSWGPTGFAIFDNQLQAEMTLAQLNHEFADMRLFIKVCRASNQGAKIFDMEN